MSDHCFICDADMQDTMECICDDCHASRDKELDAIIVDCAKIGTGEHSMSAMRHRIYEWAERGVICL